MLLGKVLWFDKKKGYGFVGSDQGDIFIHHSEIKEKYIPENNDLISFEVVPGVKGLRAKNITKVN